MEPLSTEIVTKLLSIDESDISNIRICNWEVDNTIIEAGNNYTSELTRLTIYYEKDGEPCTRNYIYKIPINAPMYETGLKMGIFKKELDMYTLVLPELRKFDKNIAPLCFHDGDKYSLILEDLSQSGYTQANRREQLDLEHCRLVFSNLAKFHAFSVHLNELNIIPDSVKEGDIFLKVTDASKFQEVSYMWSPYVGKLEEPHKSRYLTKLALKQNVMFEGYLECVRPSENKFNCLNHGDFWSANMMFKHDQYGLVESVKFIDFQMVNWCSPVIDILMFTVSSMRFEVYEKYFDLLLDIYLETLNKILIHFHYDTYKEEDFRKDIKDKFTYTFMTALTMVPLVLADSKNVDLKDIGMDKAFEGSEGFKDMLEKLDGNSYATEIIMKWLKSFSEGGQLDEWS